MDTNFDVVIVGAGSAGCILADRLTACGRKKVLLIESGKKDTSPTIGFPIGYVYNFNDKKHNYCYNTEPEKNLDNQVVYQPRGKVVGGSGSINAMIYVRGQKKDFDDWAEKTSDAWSYEAVLPYFKRIEHHHSPDEDTHNKSGKIGVTSTKGNEPELCYDFFNSCNSLGLKYNHDFNGHELAGYGFYDMNVKNGFRSSSNRTYLKDALSRPNLTLMTEADVEKIIFDGTTAKSVIVRKKDQLQEITFNDEVILSAGAIGSPKLLQLSGIGDENKLSSLGIDVVYNNPNVGENLQDHLCGCLYYESSKDTLNISLSGIKGIVKAGLSYLFNQSGPISYGVKHAGAFLTTTQEETQPNLQLYFNPISYSLPTEENAKVVLNKKSEFSFFYNICRPESTGSVQIKSKDPSVPPAIVANYLSTEKDITDAIDAFKLVRKIATSGKLSSIVKNKERYDSLNDAEILQEFKDSCGSIYHLCGTCSMGRNSTDSVVDENLKVHGVDKVRVVDASIFPNITSGNTNAPTMMVAEKASDIIRSTW